MLSPAFPSLILASRLPVLHLRQLPSIPFGQYTAGGSGYSDERPLPAVCLSQFTASTVPHPVRVACVQLLSQYKSWKPSDKLPPFASIHGFWLIAPPVNSVTGHPGFILHSVTRLLGPGLTHYYGVICHLTPLRSVLSFLLYLPIYTF